MSFVGSLSIRRKWLLLVWLSSGLIVVLCGIFFFFYYRHAFRQDLVRSLLVVADLVGRNTRPALAFDDAPGAEVLLETLSARPEISSAAIYDAGGMLFARFQKEQGERPLPRFVPHYKYRFAEGYLQVFQPILLQDERVGTVYLEMNLHQRTDQLQTAGFTILAGMVLVGATGLLLSLRLRGHLVQPILNLAATAKRVSEEKDYSLRVQKLHNDEVGDLTAAFNEMLARIQQQSALLQEKEEQVRFALEASGVGIWDYSFSSSGIRCSENVGLIFNRGPGEFCPDTAELLERIHPDDLAEARTCLDIALAEDKLCETEFRIKVEPAEWRWISLRGKLLKEDQGRPARLLGVVMDVTRRKRAEEAIQDLNQTLEHRVVERTEQLQEAVQDMESFSYSVSHDLRAPLRAIEGFARILEEDHGKRLDPEALRLVGSIIRNSRQLARLIDDLLAFSRLGRQEVKRLEIDMKALASGVFEDLRSTVPDRDIRFRIQDIPTAQGDPAMIRQVFFNLLANAIKFTRTRRPAEIEVGFGEKNGQSVFWVKDNGVGFEMQYADKLFSVFQRLHSTSEFEGTGVGLAIVRRIIQKHDGVIWAESAPEKGATFYFSL